VPESRTHRRIMTLAISAILCVGWNQSPRIDYQLRLYLAERELNANRLDEAEERLDLLILERPAKTWPRFLRAQVARKRGEITEAEEILQRAVELGFPVEQARSEHELLADRTARPGSGLTVDRPDFRPVLSPPAREARLPLREGRSR